jgi:hypothetical protein
VRARALVAIVLALGTAGCMRRPHPARAVAEAFHVARWTEAADPDAAALPSEALVATQRRWSVVVVHHSAGERGDAAAFDVMHRARGWDGVGYDFVIGNGTASPDGSIETTFRWREQRDGAHVKGWNDVAIGVCLVGDFETADPTPAQRAALVRLLRHLRRRFAISPQRVVGHGTLDGGTLCPGKRLPLAAIIAESAP